MVVVSNPSADRQEKIDSAARILRGSPVREAVFRTIYSGHKPWKTIDDIMKAVKNSGTPVYVAAAKLFHEDIITREKRNGVLWYGKSGFYSHNKKKILQLVRNKKQLDAFPTRHRPQSLSTTRVIYHSNRVQIEQIHAEDFDGFAEMKKVKRAGGSAKLAERTVKKAFKKLLAERSKTNDWGGEQNDIFTRTKVGGKRIAAAFALKGPGTSGVLTPKKMGKNGDQVVRLFRSPADAFIVQYHGQIDPSIIDLMQSLAIAESIKLNKKIYFGIIDGPDTARIIKAYQSAFGRAR
jgi:hypothetical protein